MQNSNITNNFMQNSNLCSVSVCPVRERILGVIYECNHAIVGKFLFATYRDYEVEAVYAEQIKESFDKFLRATIRGIKPTKSKKAFCSKLVTCEPLRDGYQIKMRKGGAVLARYKKYENSTYLYEAMLNFDLMKATDTYLKRLKKSLTEMQKLINEEEG